MLQQMALFDLPLGDQVRRTVRRVPRPKHPQAEGRLPSQLALRLKLARKIAFRHRTREDPNATNDYQWSLRDIFRLHLELFRDWESRFPAVTLKTEQLDYWRWMLADSNQPFSFRDVLVAAGYRNPDAFIDALPGLCPEWVKEELHKLNQTA